MKLMRSLCDEKMKKDMEILTSMKGIGEKTALNFLIEMGGDVRLFNNDKKLIAAAGLDPITYQSGKYKGKSKISKRGNRHLRRVIWLMAVMVIISNDLFRAYFFKRRKRVSSIRWRFLQLPQAHSGDVFYAVKRKIL